MVQGNANFSTLTVFFLFFGEIIGEGILLLILGYVEYMFYRFFFFLGITTTIKIFFSDTVQIFESILLDY